MKPRKPRWTAKRALEAARERIEQLEAEGVTLADTALQASIKWRVACERIAELEKEKPTLDLVRANISRVRDALVLLGWDGGGSCDVGVAWLGCKLDAVRAELGRARDDNDKLGHELERLREDNLTLSTECGALTEGNAMLGETLEETERVYKAARLNAAKLVEELEIARDENAQIHLKWQQAEWAAGDWRTMAESASAAQLTLQKEISRLTSENEELNERNSNQYGKINDLRQAFEKLAVDKQAQIDDLREELTWYKERKP